MTSIEINTSSSPKPLGEHARGLWRNEHLLVVYLPDHQFPPCCIWSGAIVDVSPQKQKFTMPYRPTRGMVDLVVNNLYPDPNEGRVVELSIPVSKSHLDGVDFHNEIITYVLYAVGPLLAAAGILFLLGLTPLGSPDFFGWRHNGHQQMCWTLIILGVVMLGFGFAWPSLSRRQKDDPQPLPCRFRRNDFVEINGASSDFLALLPDWNTSTEKAQAQL